MYFYLSGGQREVPGGTFRSRKSLALLLYYFILFIYVQSVTHPPFLFSLTVIPSPSVGWTSASLDSFPVLCCFCFQVKSCVFDPPLNSYRLNRQYRSVNEVCCSEQTVSTSTWASCRDSTGSWPLRMNIWSVYFPPLLSSLFFTLWRKLMFFGPFFFTTKNSTI